MTFSNQASPKPDPRKIFFHLENVIHSITEYIALIVNLTQFDMDDDERLGVHRLAAVVQDYALALRDGFREAFKSKEGKA